MSSSTQRISDPILTLRALRGAPATILLYLCLSGGRIVTCRQVADDLGYDEKTARRHLRGLHVLGLIQHPGPQAWLVSAQLELPGFPSILPPGSPSVDAIPSLPGRARSQSRSRPSADDPSPMEDDTESRLPRPQSDDPTRSRINAISAINPISDSVIPKTGESPVFAPTTTTAIHPSKHKSSSSRPDPPRAKPPRGKPGKIPALPGIADPQVGLSPDLTSALHAAGIGSNLWPELARLPWVNAAYISALAAQTMADPNPDRRTVALLIHRIRSHDPAPELCPDCGRPDSRHTASCPHRYRRYRDRRGDSGRGGPSLPGRARS